MLIGKFEVDNTRRYRSVDNDYVCFDNINGCHDKWILDFTNVDVMRLLC